jgi:hypothetical protein
MQRMRKFLDHDAQYIPTHFPRLMTEVAVEQGADRAVLLDGTGISPAMFQSAEALISERAVCAAGHQRASTYREFRLGHRPRPPGAALQPWDARVRVSAHRERPDRFIVNAKIGAS